MKQWSIKIENDTNMQTKYTPNETQTFELLSVKKFIFLFIVSLGIYNIWWMLKVWKIFKKRDNSDIMPLARSIFSLFYLHALFNQIQVFSKSKGYQYSFSSTAYYLGFVVLNFSSRLPGGLWVISFLSVLLMVPALKSFNYGIKHSGEYAIIENDNFNKNQFIVIAIGTFFWLLTILSIFTLDNQSF